jgi:sugar phosphate isomerase/epimerase
MFLPQRLQPGHLDLAARAGAQAIEIFAARQHFDYTSRDQVSEVASWLRSNPVSAWSMHAPLYADQEMGRSGAPMVNVLHPEKFRRIDAMDEIKRALESAEYIPFKHLVMHLGDRDDSWSPRTVEHAITALEHLGVFAAPLGVRLLVENLPSDAASPEHLLDVLKVGHLGNVGICLDLGHAHLSTGIAEAIELLGKRILSVHAHDNHAVKDEHLWPGDGSIDWKAAAEGLKALAAPPAIVLEIGYTVAEKETDLAGRIRQSFERFGDR